MCADDGENLEELPIAKTVRVKKAVVIQPVSENQKEEVRFALDVKGLAAKFKPCVPKPDKKGKILLSPDKIKIIRKHVVEAKTLEKEQRSEYPQLDVEPDEKYVTLNEQKLDLNLRRPKLRKMWNCSCVIWMDMKNSMEIILECSSDTMNLLTGSSVLRSWPVCGIWRFDTIRIPCRIQYSA